MRVGDVALHAAHRQPAGQRAAPAVFDHVPKRSDRSRFADDAVVDRFAARLERLDDGDGAVDGIAFLVGGQQEGQRAGRFRVFRQKGLGRGQHRRQRRFHVGRATPVEPAVADFRGERRAGPLRQRAGGNDIGVTGEDEQRLAVPRRAHRLVTPLRSMNSLANPSRSRRSARSRWQPASSGVSEGRAIICCASSRVASAISARCPRRRG